MQKSWRNPPTRSAPVRPGVRIPPPLKSDVQRWLSIGQIEHLDRMLLDGYGFMLENKHGIHVKSKAFMSSLPEYCDKIDQFIKSIITGDLDIIRSVCNYKNVSKARHPSSGASALHLAIIWDQFHVVAYLLANHSDLCEFLDNENRLPIHYMGAVINNSIISKDLKTSQQEFLMPLYESMNRNGHFENIIDADGSTAKQYLNGKRQLDLKIAKQRNEYPLPSIDRIGFWIKNGHFEQLERLVLDGHGPAVLCRQFPPGTEAMERRLRIYVRRIHAIRKSIADGDEYALKQLLDRKKFAIARDWTGATPLHTAIRHGRESIAEYLLLIYPFCVNAVDEEQRSALHYAYALEDPIKRQVFCNRLIQAGIDINLVDIFGFQAHQYQDQPINLLPRHKLEKAERDIFPSLGRNCAMADHTNGTDTQSSSPDPLNTEIQKWLDEGNFEQLEELVVTGKAYLLNRYAEHYQVVANFLDSVQKNQTKVEKIHEAIKEGSLRKVKNLIDRKKLVLTRSIDGQNALGLAVILDQKQIVEYLVTTYPDCINLGDKDKRTALHYAAVLADQSLFEMLKDVGADIDARDKYGFTPKDYRDNPKAMQSDSDTVMSAAAIAEQERFFQEMDAATAPTDEQITQWINDGNIDELEQIVLNGRSHLLMGKTSENVNTEEFLLALPRYQAKIDAIHKAVEEGDVRRVKSLIDRPSLAMARDRKGATPIHNAVLHGQTDTLKYLLNKFSEAVNATDHVGRSPLHYAAADKNGSVYVKMLQKSGADAFVVDKLGHTPFYYRTNPEQLNLIKLKDDAVMDQLMSGDVPSTLLQDLEEEIADWLQTGNLGKLEELVLNGYGDLLLGKSHEVEDKDVLSFLEILPQYQAKIHALHRAIENDNLRECKALMDRKKLALARDRKGSTPLHKAVLYNHTNIISWLLKNYPQAVNALDHSKRTPLHYAAALCSLDAGYSYKLLRKAGADANIPDGEGKTAKHYLNFPNELNIDALREECKAVARSVLQQRIAPSYLETSIQQWLRDGNVGKLEQLTLSGCGDLLTGRTATHPEATEFLNDLDNLMARINDIHKAVREGNLRTMKEQLNEKKKLAVARDRKGATPLHNGILYQQTEVVRYLAQSFPQCLNAPDYNKRTPLHYAAACRDGGHYYKILEKAGADPSAVDNEGKTPDTYRRNPGLLDLRIILERDRDLVPDLAIVRRNSAASVARSDSRVSELSGMTPESAFRETMHDLADDPVETNVTEAVNEAVMSPSVRGQWLRRMPPTSANGRYLAAAVGAPLTKALAEILIKRPSDPIAFLSEWLFSYHKQMEKDN